MKIYHYTKGIHLNSIFTDGFIATEQTRNLNYWAPFATDLAWFTEKTTCPITALPRIPSIPATNLKVQASIQNLHTDFIKIGTHIGSFWRFGFDSEKSIFEKWHFSKAKKDSSKNPLAFHMEKIARDVGDEPRKFWVSSQNVPLINTTLEYLSPISREWEIVMDEFSITDKSPATQMRIIDLCDLSKEICNQLGFPYLSLKKAA
jgi:hypothetical protein